GPAALKAVGLWSAIRHATKRIARNGAGSKRRPTHENTPAPPNTVPTDVVPNPRDTRSVRSVRTGRRFILFGAHLRRGPDPEPGRGKPWQKAGRREPDAVVYLV